MAQQPPEDPFGAFQNDGDDGDEVSAADQFKAYAADAARDGRSAGANHSRESVAEAEVSAAEVDAKAKAEAVEKKKKKQKEEEKRKKAKAEAEAAEAAAEEAAKAKAEADSKAEAEAKAAEEKRIADEKAAAEAKAAAARAAEEKRIADAKAAEDARIAAEAKQIADAKAAEDARIAAIAKKKADDEDHKQRHAALARIDQLRGENDGLAIQVADFKKNVAEAQKQLEQHQAASIEASRKIEVAEQVCKANGRTRTEVDALIHQTRDLETLEAECQAKIKELTMTLDSKDPEWRTKKAHTYQHFDKQDHYHHEELMRQKAEKEAAEKAAAEKAAADAERAKELKFAHRFDHKVVVENNDSGEAVLQRMEKKLMNERGGPGWFARNSAASILGAEAPLPPKDYASWPAWKKKKWDWQHGASRKEEHGEKGLYDVTFHTQGHEALAKSSTTGETLAYEQHTY